MFINVDYLNVITEIMHTAMVPGLFQMVIKPTQQNFFRRKSHEVINCLSLPQETGQSRYICQCDVGKQANLKQY